MTILFIFLFSRNTNNRYTNIQKENKLIVDSWGVFLRKHNSTLKFNILKNRINQPNKIKVNIEK